MTPLDARLLSGAPAMLGIARFSADPDIRLARFAVAVRNDSGAGEDRANIDRASA
jgi:hypothetical protein